MCVYSYLFFSFYDVMTVISKGQRKCHNDSPHRSSFSFFLLLFYCLFPIAMGRCFEDGVSTWRKVGASLSHSRALEYFIPSPVVDFARLPIISLRCRVRGKVTGQLSPAAVFYSRHKAAWSMQNSCRLSTKACFVTVQTFFSIFFFFCERL